jgi:5-methylcytosine-specific restriction protein B
VKANEVRTFRELEPGDTVIADRGTSQVVGIGTVIEPGYAWRPEREVYKHTVSVQWTDITERTLDPPVTSWFGSTVAKVPGDLYQRITAPGGTDGGSVSRPPVSPEPVLPEILSGLQRRGQVVLYGPRAPGRRTPHGVLQSGGCSAGPARPRPLGSWATARLSPSANTSSPPPAQPASPSSA